MQKLRKDVKFSAAALADFCDRHKVTAATVCQIAWALVLQSFTNNDNVYSSDVTSGRHVPLEGINKAIGLFVETQINHVRFDEGAKLLDIVLSKHTEFLGGLHGSGSSHLWETTKETRKSGNSILSFHRSLPSRAYTKAMLSVEILERTSPNNYDFSINIDLERNSITLNLDFWESRVHKDYADNVAEVYTRAIEHIICSSCEYANRFLPLTRTQAHAAREYSSPGTSSDDCIHDLVRETVAIRPTAPAVCAWDGDLTYSELHVSASRLAHHLVELGVRPETMVGLCMDKSRWAVDAMLAVLQAGGAVVPLGVQHPRSRVETILRDTGAPIILVDAQQAARLSDLAAHLVTVEVALASDALRERSVSASELPCTTVKPGHPAWVVYTSGSTGVPKGVVLEHAGLTTSLVSHSKVFGMDFNTRTLQFAAHTFDICISDIFATLLQGGCVCVLSESGRVDNLVHEISAFLPNFADLTLTVLRLLHLSDVHSLTTIVVTGEALDDDTIRSWACSTCLFNAYGPAESSILAASTSRNQDTNEAGLIGRPLAGRFWVTHSDSPDRLCPIGVPGELLIEGPLLARGYLNDEAKTAASFIVDPAFVGGLGLAPDLVRQNRDGSFTFLGRRDAQIKIRGQRIEIGEVEHHITRHPAVRDAVVTLLRHGSHAGRLATVTGLRGYVMESTRYGPEVCEIQDDDQAAARLQTADVRHHLSQQVMQYMVPTAELSICRALRPSDSCGTPGAMSLTSRASNSHSSSRFSLGGDSITAIQVVSTCRGVGLSVTVRDVLQSRAISELALTVSSSGDSLHDLSEIPEGPFPLSPVQQLFAETIAPTGLRANGDYRYNQSVCLRLQQDVDASMLSRAFEALVAKHAMLRARFRLEGDADWQQHIEQKLLGSYHFQAHSARDQAEASDIVQIARGSLDVRQGPVFAAHLIRLQDRQVLFLTAHHLVIDLVSWRILPSDLEELLSKRTLSRAHALSFPMWYQLLAQFTVGRSGEALKLPFEVLPTAWDYWGLEPATNVVGHRISVTAQLQQSATLSLFGVANEALRTDPVDILVAALFCSFSRVFPDQEVPVVFNEGHGRECWDRNIDLSDTVGWFTTMTPLHSTAKGRSLVDVLKQTKEYRRQFVQHGLLYFASRFLTEHGRQTYARHNSMEVLFNYAGRYQQLERADGIFCLDPLDKLNHEGKTSAVGAATCALAVLDVSATVVAGQLEIEISLSKYAPHQSSLRRWAAVYIETVAELVETLGNTAPMITPSGFPLTVLTDAALATLEQKLLASGRVLDVGTVEDVLPCSPVQEGILLSQRKSPDTYRIQHMCRVRPTDATELVDTDRLSLAWQRTIDHHSIMRTMFADSVDGQAAFHQIELRSYVADVCVAECQTYSDVERYVAIQPPVTSDTFEVPHRFTIFILPGSEVYGHFEISHALVDATSVDLLVQHLPQAYDQPLPVIEKSNYSTYVSYLHERPFQEDWTYWKTLLTDTEPCHLSIPSKGALPIEADTPSWTELTARVADPAALLHFPEKHGLTIANVFQLAWSLVLSTYSEANEVTFGYLANGRDVPIPGVHTLVGAMINMMICHFKVDSSTTVLDSVRSVQEQSLEGLDHQRVSLAAVQHSLRMSEQALFNTIMSYKRQVPAATSATPTRSLLFDGLESNDPTEYDVSVNISASEDQMLVSLRTRSTAFPPKVAARLLDHLMEVVETISQNGRTTLDELSFLPRGDRATLLEWISKVPPRMEACIHDLVRETVTIRPTAPAVCAWDGDLTYSELHDSASRLAHHLVKLGVRPETMVGLCMDKSRWAVDAMLAVLQAGGAVVPLGVQHPRSRVETILRDTGAPIILVDAQQAARLSDLAAHLVTVEVALASDALRERFVSASDLPCTTVKPGHPAWVVYTSGSTGVPKGVVLEHAALCTSMRAHGSQFGHDLHTRQLQFAAHTFDATIQEVFTTFRQGGCVCIPSEEGRLNDLERYVNDLRVTSAPLTSTVAALIEPTAVPSLRKIVLVGEAVSAAVVEQWLPHGHLLHAYGPTECCIHSTCSRPIQGAGDAGVIGYALAGRLWVTRPDSPDRLCPIGVPGELLIESPLLARGYLNDEAKTAASFIVDPAFVGGLGLAPGRRMYRTGDLVRQNHDGSFTFLGRRDTQIKIRGQRVEIGEIETWISRLLPSTRAACVDLIQPADSGSRPL
nr:nonribosomal peptide synthetase vlms [Quercus suber]